MRGGLRRVSIVVVAVLLFAIGSPARAAEALLPSDTLLFDSNRTGNYELYTTSTTGEGLRQLTDDVRYDSWWPKLSPDRRDVLFVRVPKGTHDRDYKQITTWVLHLDGGALEEILPYGVHGWAGQGHPEWSPDGTRIVTMCEKSSSVGNVQICVVDADGQHPVQVTSRTRSTQVLDTSAGEEDNRGGINVDPSWHPNGHSIVFVGCPTNVCWDNLYELYSVEADGSGETRLTDDAFRDHDPYWSPDGATVAWLRQTSGPLNWGIMAQNADGSGQRAIIDDGAINSKPEWLHDGSTIFFHRTPIGSVGFNVWSIRPDGSGLTELLEHRGPGIGGYDNEYPSPVHVTVDGDAAAAPVVPELPKPAVAVAAALVCVALAGRRRRSVEG
jgi:Tol biopolymer transport system component